MLVELAKQMEAVILTADVGMSRVAAIQGVKVLNLNEVANSLKPALIPGEQLTLKLIKPGEQAGQGVGYLEDGTMVVAEDGRAYVGSEVTLNVTSSLQTSAGRLIFGRVVDGIAVEHLARPELPAAASEPAAGAPDQADAEEPPPADGPAPIHVAPPAPEPHRGPFPPKPPNKRVNPFRNPRR
jgi:hypothetical protein